MIFPDAFSMGYSDFSRRVLLGVSKKSPDAVFSDELVVFRRDFSGDV